MAFIPLAFFAALAVGYGIEMLGGMVLMLTWDLGAPLFALGTTICGGLASGATMVYVGVFVAPGHKKVAAFIVFLFLLALVGTTQLTLKIPDIDLFNMAANVVGATAILALVYRDGLPSLGKHVF